MQRTLCIISARPPTCPTLLVLRSQAADSLASSPDLKLTDLLHLLLECLTVVWATSVLHGALSLLASLDRVVKVIEDWLESLLEALAPVNGTTTSGGGAGGVHVVHTVGTNEWVERLSSLLDSLVESLGRRVAVLTENLVLSEEHAVDTTHQATTLTVQVGVDLLLEGGLVHVARADGHAESDGLLLGLAGHVLPDGDGAVDTTALLEESAHGTPGTLWCNEDDIDVGWDLNLGLGLEDWGETVGEVEGLQHTN